jgi:two-component system, OmpR family, response regulator
MAELAIRSDGQPVSVGVCEDDHRLRDVLRRALSAEGYTVRLTASGEQAIEAFIADPPQLLVLDITLADRDGREVCAALRAHGLDLPVLFLSGRRELEDRLAAFEAGADDYLTKPFELEELLVRIRGLLRRADARRRHISGDDGLRLDAATHAVVLGEREVPLTRTEFRVLATLLGARPNLVHRSLLAATAWPDTPRPAANTLDSCVARVRSKLREVGSDMVITAVRGVGYRLP